MTSPVSLEPSRKRQEADYLDPPRPPLKRQKLELPYSVYWDNLSKIWLTRDALEELDRRNSASSRISGPPHSHHRPFTRQLQARLKRRYQTLTPDSLIDLQPESLSEIRRFSRRGGPDLSDPGMSQALIFLFTNHRKRRAGSPSDSSNNKTTKTTSTTAYNRNFEQKLIDNGVYPKGYELRQPRSSLSPSKFCEKDFQKSEQADTNTSKEKPVTSFVVPTIDGDIDDPKCVGGDYPFGNLAPLTDGTLANAKPDHFFGAHPEQLKPEIRDELNEFIIPSTQSSLPMAPNFFLEAKGPDGSPAVATRQACYDGVLGLEEYINFSHTSGMTGQLKFYTTHPTVPRESDGRSEYIMTQLNAWSMVGSADGFRQGASAYRNARDWAKEQRDEFIKSANERHTQALSELLSSEREPTSEPTVVLEGSDTSATSDEAEFHDAEWSFAHPNDSAEDRASNKHTRAEPTSSNSRKSLQN
ncbi:hypothetical protein LOZ12_004139 [Ophidiomyces ophidiicola]|uniref:Uncharacterized protein n=1 Tax=Ophidiomyces ophidiicola TaxID=1387563 RepID=A0ACB8V180_9EURO|nr:hypothetical protein LOZ61_004119 [Ophidiomyces ophidiicola]KAI1924021.1 hypothetical protein LOZ64_000763 [Ophidiomyces ophidiicola]KAI1927827.1 hypothetical protein LOZ60_002792 [Ophidiomyces ophidiicola]KAI1948728.1 hypothetical protein LOZ62_002543 [Ophidiomyces ophidiicola]KAI1954908.1 hypothetical protein LOZ59_004789 [Ophidiomyces ophidiicola]